MIRAISGLAIRRPLLVVLLWVAVVAAGFGVGTGVFARLVPDVGMVPGSESETAEQRLEEATPQPETMTAVISGVPADDPALLARTAEAIDAARGVTGIAAVSDPLPSTETGEALLVEVTIAPDADNQAVQAAAERLHQRIALSEAEPPGPELPAAPVREPAPVS